MPNLQEEEYMVALEQANMELRAELSELREDVDKMLNTDSSDLETLILAVGELAVSSGYFDRKATGG